ncbi:xanthine dehydrogenase family protein subunit M [candidate division KSB1 bacterium]|nr:xanthine dehydrogenase family protein subunit M [candidate division KSB1 bacterium]RQW00851.1 MAG: xanthine dehydrogenase family protein subunit M [candidate division KSB1 bacterium]
MKPFQYVYPKDIKAVPKILAEAGQTALLYAGGTDALARMKEGVSQPDVVVNLKEISGFSLIRSDKKGLSIGAGTLLADVVESEEAQDYPGLVEAVKAVGTIQLRNMGTIGGNLCQRPRCWYYRSARFDCLRKGGETCFAIYGDNKYHCIIGGNPCFIVHPSDVAPMLIALDATIEILGLKGSRWVKAEEFYVTPQQDPYNETILKSDEVVTSVHIPAQAKSLKSHYVKFRERDSFDFAMVSVAIVASISDNTLSNVRIAYGGVAPKPWRATRAEKALEGTNATEQQILDAATGEFAQAEPLEQNEYKVIMAKNLLKRAIRELRQG